jgi:tRNA/tmRNA/rRNA uracil-C5-methylase (TrmA/RlmC/RlmD family)
VELGIFEEGSHRLVAIPRCPVHHPAINALVAQLSALANQLGIAPYQEDHHKGLLRAVQMAVQPSTGRVQLVLLVLAQSLSAGTLDPGLSALARELAPQTHSIFFASLPDRNNSLLGKEWLHVHGPDMLLDQVGGSRVYFPPDAFGQANPMAHARAVAKIHELASGSARVVEYYAGVGTIGLGLAQLGRRVVFNEMGAGSLRGLARALDEAGAQEVEVVAGPAGKNAHLYGPGDTVIVDPPRKGLDAELMARLLDDPPGRLIYLSCGLPAFLTESRRLYESGRYNLTHLSAWAYFPYTEHIETLAVFDSIRSGVG